jgi:hypothetical protein
LFERYTLIGLAVAFVLVAADFYLLRNRKIRGKTFVIWLLIGAVVGLFAAVPALISFITDLFGTEFTVSAVVAGVFILFLLTSFYFNYRISELQMLLTRLATEISVKKFDEEKNVDDSGKKSRKQESHEPE